MNLEEITLKSGEYSHDQNRIRDVGQPNILVPLQRVGGKVE